MKAKYLFIGLALACVLGACSREEESLFDKSAAERAQEALDNANEVLVAPTNGWEMLYFANLDSKGYNLIMKFEANGQVIATAKNTETTKNKLLTDSASTWQVKLDYGPILTFDTYNDVFHAWADPGTDGDGLLGDYEFLILHADANYIKLKGKKHGAYCYLYPLEQGVTAEKYYEDIDAAQKRFSGNNNLLHVQAGGQENLLFNGSKGIFYLTALGERPNTEELDTYPFAIRRNGIQLTAPFLNQRGTFFELVNGVLESEDTKITAAAPADYVGEYIELASGSWYIDFNNSCDSIMSVIAAINSTLKATYPKNSKAGVSALRFQKISSGLVLTLSYYGSSSKSATNMNYRFDLVKENEDLKIAYLEPSDENAQKALNAFPQFETLFTTLSGVHALTTTDPINPSNGILLTNKSNSELWFPMAAKI